MITYSICLCTYMYWNFRSYFSNCIYNSTIRNYNSIHFKQHDLLDTERGVGPLVGVTGELNIPGIGFGVDASALYSMRSGKVNYGEHLAWSSLGYGNETVKMHYIDVPINLKFKWHKMNGLEEKIMPLVYAGPTFSFLAAKNCTDLNSYSPVSVYVHFGLGCELMRRVQVAVDYSFGVGETLHTHLLDENVAKNRTWSAHVTYFIK